MEPADDRFKRLHCAWYQFALIAHDCDIPEIKKRMNKSRLFYRPWSLDEKLNADEWWKSHQFLFEEQYEVRKLKPGQKPRDQDALILEIPLRKSPTKLKNIITDIITNEMDARGLMDSKSFTRSSARYIITEGRELKINAIEDLRWFLIADLKSEDLKGYAKLLHIQEYYQKHKKQTGGIPSSLTFRAGDQDHLRNALRRMRNNHWKSWNILQNVASGLFPGDYY